MARPDKRCETCVFWTDLERRVFARLSSGTFQRTTRMGATFTEDPNSDRGVELRLCRFQPPPTVQQNSLMHTDAGYVCSAHMTNPDSK